jgi:Flp pilus assembly protein TadG
MRVRGQSAQRPGTAIVESAFVLSVFLMLLFGIFEYCRFLYVMHLTANAARDAARYAVVNTSKPTNFDTTSYTDGTGKTYVSVTQYARNLMGGMDKNISGWAVAVFPCDPAKLSQSPPVVQSKASPTTWNSAAFTEKIAVQITGTYQPILPSLLWMPSSIPVNVVSVCGSEG